MFCQRHSIEERGLPDDWEVRKMDEFFKVFAKEEMMETIEKITPSLSRISLPLRYVVTVYIWGGVGFVPSVRFS